MENSEISAVFLPDIGSKMVSLVHARTGRQFLLDPQPRKPLYWHPKFGERFAQDHAYGFDDCFPTVAQCLYKSPAQNGEEVHLPDHGELWSRPWKFVLSDDEVVFSIEGVLVPYRFEKRVRLAGNRLIFSYTVQNPTKEPVRYLWSAHPLLQVAPGTQILLPPAVDRMLLEWTLNESIGTHGDVVPWPYLATNGEHINYAEVQPRSLGQAVKCFTDVLEEGYAVAYYPDTAESLQFEFDPKQIPHVGLWLSYGGWPVGSRNPHLTVALEPSTTRFDSLEEAIERGEYSEVPPNATRSWSMGISVWKGVPRHDSMK